MRKWCNVAIAIIARMSGRRRFGWWNKIIQSAWLDVYTALELLENQRSSNNLRGNEECIAYIERAAHGVRKELIRGITMTIIALAPGSRKKAEGIRASQISGAF